MDNNNYEGTVSYTSRPDKGFGFVICKDLPDPVFFHASGLKNCLFPDLKVGDKVSFAIASNNRGKICGNIYRIEST